MKVNNTYKNHIQISTLYSSNANFTENVNSKEYNNNSNHSLYNDKVYKAKTHKNKKINSNNDLKLNYSNSSINSHSSNNSNNISNLSIQSIINTIGGKAEIKDIKIKNYNSESDNNTNTKNSKYVIKNYSHVSTKQKNDKIINKDNKQLSLIYKQKIENAKINEEILLPNGEIELDTLTIRYPIKIKGQSNSVLYIKDGPISIDYTNYKNNNNNNNFIKLTQLRIIYTDNQLNKEKKITSLFKIYPSSFLELEDCDIVFQTKKNEIIPSGMPKPSALNNDKKSVAFLQLSNKRNENNNLYPSTLNLTNTRIQNFFQSIRAGQNCIININKSAFVQNYGKAIVMINPLFLKIAESYFENNGDNCIHIKFIEDCLYEEKRKLFFNKNEFNLTMGNNICIEGLKDSKLDLSIVITKNNFSNNIFNGVLIFDLFYNYIEINDNIFKKNKENGLFIQKTFYNEINNTNNKNINFNMNNSYRQVKILNNKFIENKGFGLFINDCEIEVISNKFFTNRQSGMFLGDIIIDEPKKGLEGVNLGKINLNKNVNFYIKKCFISKNSFYENGANGLHIYGYPYQINIHESIFSSNCQNGIALYMNEDSNSNKKLEEFNKSNNSSGANIILNKCLIQKNFKNGIMIDFGLIFCEESFIIDNIDNAIFIKKKEYQKCFKEGKKCEINGTIGGNWGEINLNKDVSCGFSCMPKKNNDINSKLKEEIVKKAPNLNDSDDNINDNISYNEIKIENKNNEAKEDKNSNCVIF